MAAQPDVMRKSVGLFSGREADSTSANPTTLSSPTTFQICRGVGRVASEWMVSWNRQDDASATACGCAADPESCSDRCPRASDRLLGYRTDAHAERRCKRCVIDLGLLSGWPIGYLPAQRGITWLSSLRSSLLLQRVSIERSLPPATLPRIQWLSWQ